MAVPPILALVNVVIYSCALAWSFWMLLEQFWNDDNDNIDSKGKGKDKTQRFLSRLKIWGPIGPRKLFFMTLTLLYCGRFFEFFYISVFRTDVDNSYSDIVYFAHLLASCFYMGAAFIVSINIFCKLHRVSHKLRVVLILIATALFIAMVIVSIISLSADSFIMLTEFIEMFIVLFVFLVSVLLLVSTIRLKNWTKRLKKSFVHGSGRGRHYLIIFQAAIISLIVILGLQSIFSFMYLASPDLKKKAWFVCLDYAFMLWLPEVFPGGVLLAMIMRGRDLNKEKRSNGNKNGHEFMDSTRRKPLLDESRRQSSDGKPSYSTASSYIPIKLSKVTFKNSYEVSSSSSSMLRHGEFGSSDGLGISRSIGSVNSDRQPLKLSQEESGSLLSQSQSSSSSVIALNFDDAEVDVPVPPKAPKECKFVEYTEFSMRVIYRDPLIDTVVFVHMGDSPEEEARYRALLGSALKEGALVDGEIDRIDFSLHDKPEAFSVIPKSILVPNADIAGCDAECNRAPSLLLLALGHDSKSSSGTIVLGLAKICARNIYDKEPISLLFRDTVLEELAQSAPQQQQQHHKLSSPQHANQGKGGNSGQAKYPPLHCVGSFVLHKDVVHSFRPRSLAQGSCMRTFVCSGHITEFDGLYSKDVVLNVCEELWESTFAFGIPRDIIAATIPTREEQLKDLMEERAADEMASPKELNLASIEDASVQQTLSERTASILQGLSDHIEAMKEYCSLCRSGRLASSFKASVQKKSGDLRFNPTNLHVQFMTVFPRDVAEDDASGDSGKEDLRSYAFVTLGAPVAYGYQSGCEGGAHQLAKRLKKIRAAESSTESASLEEKLAVIVLDMVKDVVVCQIACALADAFAAELERRASLGYDQEIAEFFAQVENVGFLICFESLLSTFGQERQMLGDFEYAVCCLDKFKLRIVKTSALTFDECPEVCRQDDLWIINIRCPESTFSIASEELCSGKLIDVCSVLFTQGINEQQTVANAMGTSGLQDSINSKHYGRLAAYYDRYTTWRFSVDPSPITESEVSALTPLLHKIEKETTKRRTGRTTKNTEILPIVADFCRKLHGGRCTSCKSAKDRTAMSVTWEQARILKEYYGVSENDLPDIIKSMRAEGVRRFNVTKNTGGNKYAFNPLQNLLLPQVYRSPKKMIGGNVPT